MNRSIRRAVVASLASILTLGASAGISSAWGQSKAAPPDKQIVGVWKLVSAVNTGADGVAKPGSYGPNPKGVIIFTESGHYAVVNSNPDIPKFASGNRFEGTAEENKAVVRMSNSSYGTYKVSPDGKVLTLKIEGGSWGHWNGTEQKRELTLSGDDMKYALAASRGGRSVLAFKRVK